MLYFRSFTSLQEPRTLTVQPARRLEEPWFGESDFRPGKIQGVHRPKRLLKMVQSWKNIDCTCLNMSLQKNDRCFFCVSRPRVFLAQFLRPWAMGEDEALIHTVFGDPFSKISYWIRKKQIFFGNYLNCVPTFECIWRVIMIFICLTGYSSINPSKIDWTTNPGFPTCVWIIPLCRAPLVKYTKKNKRRLETCDLYVTTRDMPGATAWCIGSWVYKGWGCLAMSLWHRWKNPAKTQRKPGDSRWWTKRKNKRSPKSPFKRLYKPSAGS